MKVLDNETPERPDISYPTAWNYKLIGRDIDKLVNCVKSGMIDRNNKKHTCTQGNASRTGKFHSYNTTCTVANEEERNELFKYFEDHCDVDMVI